MWAQIGALQAARHPTKCDVINDVKLFPTVYRRIYCRNFLTFSHHTSRYKLMCIRICDTRPRLPYLLLLFFAFATRGRCWTANFTLRKFHIVKNNWYQFLTACVKLVPIGHIVRTNISHIERYAHKIKFYIALLNHEFHTSLISSRYHRNWPYVRFTFAKSKVLVPILHMVWISSVIEC